MRVHLDTLRARASALARSGRLPEEARPRVQAALGSYADCVSRPPAGGERRGGRRARADRRRRPRGPCREAGRDVGRGVGALRRRRFAGLCGADPAHGPPAGEGPLTPGGAARAAVRELPARRAERGEPVPVRMVPDEGRPVPFTEVEELPAPGAGGPPGQELRASPS